jgi:hypothetical protein
MRHIKTLTRTTTPAPAVTNIIGCFQDLIASGDLAAFKQCLGLPAKAA